MTLPDCTPGTPVRPRGGHRKGRRGVIRSVSPPHQFPVRGVGEKPRWTEALVTVWFPDDARFRVRGVEHDRYGSQGFYTPEGLERAD